MMVHLMNVATAFAEGGFLGSRARYEPRRRWGQGSMPQPPDPPRSPRGLDGRSGEEYHCATSQTRDKPAALTVSLKGIFSFLYKKGPRKGARKEKMLASERGKETGKQRPRRCECMQT